MKIPKLLITIMMAAASLIMAGCAANSPDFSSNDKIARWDAYAARYNAWVDSYNAALAASQAPPVGPQYGDAHRWKEVASTYASGDVWVNTYSGIYHYPGTRWYGNTNSGQYMSEEEALAEGYRPARNGQ
jgi:hypothetical protein